MREATAGYERWLTVDVIRAFEAFVEDLSNWYIRRSRRRFWDGDEVALRTLWHALVADAARDRAGDAVPGRAPLAGARARACEDAPASVFLAGWPEASEPDEGLLAEVADVRRVVALGHQARQARGLQGAAAAPRARRRGCRTRGGRRPRRSATSCG